MDPIEQEMQEKLAKFQQTPPQPPTGNNEGGGAPNQQDPPPQPPATEPIQVDLSVFGENFKDKKIDDVAGEFKSMTARIQEYENKIKEIETRSPQYADVEVAEYDAWIKNGGTKDYSVFKQIQSFTEETAKTMDAIDKIVLKTVIEEPSYKGYEQKLKQKLIDQYGIEANEINGLDEETVRFNKVKLERDAKDAEKFVLEQKSKLKVEGQAPINQNELIEKRKPIWKQVADNASTLLSKIPIPMTVSENGQSKIEKLTDFEVPQELVDEYRNQIVEVYSKYGDATPEMQQTAILQAQRELVYSNLPKIVNHVADVVRKQVIDEYDKKYGGGNHPKPPGSASTQTTAAQDLKQWMENL